MVVMPQNRKGSTIPGAINFLVPLYNNALPGSALRLATESAAMGALAKGPGGKWLLSLALASYGEALKAVVKATKIRNESRSDELVQAILMLLLYEVCPFASFDNIK